MYNVTIDRNAMRQELLGPIFQRHVVSLAGTVDARWLDSYEEVARDSDALKSVRARLGVATISARSPSRPYAGSKTPRRT